MVNFSLKQSAYGSILWSLFMGMGISMMYLPLIPYKEAFFSLIFPLILSVMPKTAYFYVNQSVIIIAGIITFLYMLLLRINKKIRQSLSEPLKYKKESVSAYGSAGVTFVLSMIGASYFIPMYSEA